LLSALCSSASLKSNALLFASGVKESVFQPVFIGPSLLCQILLTMSTQNSDDAMFSSILKSMGITSYDRLVVTALNEYARRYGGTLLSDAQDYAEHAGRMVSDDLVVACTTPFNCALTLHSFVILPLNTPEGN
jgi:histone H3/H4